MVRDEEPCKGIGVGVDPCGRSDSFADHDKEEPDCTKKVVKKT